VDVATGDSGSAGAAGLYSGGTRFGVPEPPIACAREHVGSRRLARPAIAIGSGPNSQIGK